MKGPRPAILSVLFGTLLLPLIAGSAPLKRPAGCTESLYSAFQPKAAFAYRCPEKDKVRYCKSSVGPACKKMNPEKGFIPLKAYAFKTKLKNFSSNYRVSKNKLGLASFLDLLHFKKAILKQPKSYVQTGPYAQMALSSQYNRSVCLLEMLEAGLLLQTHLPEFNFRVEELDKNCSRILKAAFLIVNNKGKIKTNLQTFHTPLHTIFLGSQTKFNTFQLGRMGLYINLDKEGELEKRLLRLEITQNQIPYETSIKKMGGLSKTK